MRAHSAKFTVGDVIRHRLFHYRGVIVDVDAEFSGSEQWYDRVARSRPPKDEPWYRVLVHGAEHQTYVAERNIDLDDSGGPVDHPLLEMFFESLEINSYRRRSRLN